MNMDPNVIITMRVSMTGKEVGGVIGKEGKTIEEFRQKSCARIHISSQQFVQERIVTVTGEQSQVCAAFELICAKMEKDTNSGVSTTATSKVPISIQLIVPGSQCGSIIGKGGNKIKQIRDATGCAIKVHSDMLPNSTERAVILSGAPSAIVHCIDMLCDVMIQFPARTATVPYTPMPEPTSIFMQQEQNFMLKNGQFAEDVSLNKLSSGNESSSSKSSRLTEMKKGSSGSMHLPTRFLNSNTQELTVPNEIIGSIIGKGGSRIHEIRSMSGAQVKIDRGSDDKDSNIDRKITISGTPESISLAHYLINTSIQLFSNQSKPDLPASSDNSPDTTEEQQAPKPLMSFYTCPTPQPIPNFLGPLGSFNSLMGPHPYSGFSPGSMHGDTFSLALQNAKRNFLSRPGNKGPRYSHQSNRNKNQSSTKTSKTDKKSSSSSADSSNQERKRIKREKFSPY